MKKFFRTMLAFVALFALTFTLSPNASAAESDEPTQDLTEIAMGNEDFSILVTALQKTELVETLQGEGPFTVFAPTNAAFEALLADLDVTAEELLAQPDLARVLRAHVVPGIVMAGDLTDGMKAETVNGETITFDLSGDPTVNDSTISATDLMATNGVIHVIDQVIIPADFELQAVDMEEMTVPQTGIESSTWIIVSILAVGALFTFVYVKKEA